MSKPFGFWHIAYLVFFGLGGWTMLVWASAARPEIFAPWQPSFELATTGVMVGAARLLAFRIFQRSRIALDSAFYIAASFIFGTVPAAWMIAIALTLDGAVSLLRGLGPLPRGEAPLRYTLAHIMFNGGLPCFVLMLVSMVFGGDQSIHGMTDASLSWMVPGFALTFLVTHYFFAGGNAYFVASSNGLWRLFFRRVVGAEITLVPLTLAMTMAYKHQGAELFFILGATGLLFGGIFRRWSITSDKLRERVDELSAINRIGRIISGSFDQSTLYQNLSVATLQLVGSGSVFMIGLLDELGETVAYGVYDQNGECKRRIMAGREEGLSGWVMSHKEGLCIGDVQTEYLNYAKDDRYNDERFHSWLAVPMVVYDEVVGVMSVQCKRKYAYGLAHLRVLATIADQAAVAIENSRLYQFATVDGLTGLFVRRYFDQRLVEEWHRAARYDTAFSLGMLDLDHFKKFNDTYGHQVGDQVLRAAARVVRDNMRSFDLAARYGGEEFVFILPRTVLTDAEAVAERIRRDVEKIRIETADGEVGVTVSIGVADCTDDSLTNHLDLIARADAALYVAKADGRNRVRAAEPVRRVAAGNRG